MHKFIIMLHGGHSLASLHSSMMSPHLLFVFILVKGMVCLYHF